MNGPRHDPRALAGRRLHMMGIGGAGVSALAQLASAWGADVDGCDRERSHYVELVEQAGVGVAIGHDPAHVEQEHCELVVSSAVADDESELARARELGRRVLLRGELLGELTRVRSTVVIAGAHGKSTTTSMVAHAAIACGLDPSVAVGAVVPALAGNVRLGSSRWFVVEGDESDRTLLQLSAQVAVLTNIERDHHHTFHSEQEVDDLFRQWVWSLGPDATVVAGPDERVGAVVEGAPCRVVRFGQDEQELDAIARRLAVPGRHNALNAAAAIAALELMEVAPEESLEALADFQGVGRRFEHVGTAAGVIVVDDYSHHPTEVRAAIAAARERLPAGGSLTIVFQPHLYSRTQALHAQFAEALAAADRVLLLPVYGAREQPIEGVTSELIAAGLPGSARVVEVDPATGELSTITGELKEGDLVITMGAGTVTALAPRIVAQLGERGDPPWLERDAPLHRFTTIGTGGPARFFARVESEQALHQALTWAAERDLPVATIGLGSNTLIDDRGFEGLAIRLAGELAVIEIEQRSAQVRCGGGASLAAIVRLCRDAGLSQFEFACAIPGTVGGAVKMNAGAYGGEMVDVLASVRLVSARGAREVQPSELEMSYRHTNIGWDEVVASAVLSLGRDDPGAIKERVKQMQGRRTSTQPRAARSFGSVFRNPVAGEGNATVGDPPPGAGALIERAGLKGHELGGARISPKHGNFIENAGDATTADILGLIELARNTVQERFGVTLHTEVHLLGPDGYRPLLPLEVAP